MQTDREQWTVKRKTQNKLNELNELHTEKKPSSERKKSIGQMLGNCGFQLWFHCMPQRVCSKWMCVFFSCQRKKKWNMNLPHQCSPKLSFSRGVAALMLPINCTCFSGKFMHQSSVTRGRDWCAVIRPSVNERKKNCSEWAPSIVN